VRALITQSNFGKSFERKGRLLEPNKTTLKCYFEFICVKHRLMTTYGEKSPYFNNFCAKQRSHSVYKHSCSTLDKL